MGRSSSPMRKQWHQVAEFIIAKLSYYPCANDGVSLMSVLPGWSGQTGVKIMAKRPSVTTSCVADSYSMACERIIEFNSNDGTGRGGLISLRVSPDTGAFVVNVYRLEGCTVHVTEG